jgi:hypothetical protein
VVQIKMRGFYRGVRREKNKNMDGWHNNIDRKWARTLKP